MIGTVQTLEVSKDEYRGLVGQGVSKYLGELGKLRFYGTIEIMFQDGEIMLVRKEESFKPHVFVSL